MLRCFLNPLHECIRQTGRHLPKANSARPAAYRGFRTTPSCNRDLFAKYRRADDPSSSAGKDSATFQTVSTVPAGSSFQDVPAPLTDKNEVKSRMAIPLPAMASLDETRSKPVQARGREEIVQGVVVPAKPRPPTEEECCMSGCVNCVYNVYADDLEFYTTALSSAREALLRAGTPEKEWPEAVKVVGAKGAKGMEQGEKAKMEEGMDPVMAAFLALEGKLRKKQGSGTV